MSERIYITKTGERVRERGGLVEVVLSAEAQAAIGDLMHFQPRRIGDWVNVGDQLFVVEGSRSAAEFYAPVSGRIASYVAPNAQSSDFLIRIVCCRSDERAKLVKVHST